MLIIRYLLLQCVSEKFFLIKSPADIRHDLIKLGNDLSIVDKDRKVGLVDRMSL
jgi:hypothetical protein